MKDLLKIAAGVYLGGIAVYITILVYTNYQVQRVLDEPERLVAEQKAEEQKEKVAVALARSKQPNPKLEKNCIKRVNMALGTSISEYEVLESRGSFVSLKFKGHDQYSQIDCREAGVSSLVAEYLFK
jgi:hypothetical protein